MKAGYLPVFLRIISSEVGEFFGGFGFRSCPCSHRALSGHSLRMTDVVVCIRRVDYV